MLKTKLSSGDLQRELGISRAVFERLLRDYARELPDPELLMGCRVWNTGDLGRFQDVLARDAAGRRR